MNLYAPQGYDEHVSRLALGIEPVDAAREEPALASVAIGSDGPSQRRAFKPRSGGRFALLYDKASAAAVQVLTIRLFPSDDAPRRFVPRRLRFTVPKLEVADAQAAVKRACRPRLFPGAAYPVRDTATGLRARVMRTAPARPARWTRVIATTPSRQTDLSLAKVVGRGFGDDRGEFLLLLAPGAVTGAPAPTLEVRVTVFAESAEPAFPVDGAHDPLWDAPLEQPATTDDTDPVVLGRAMPAGWTAVAFRKVTLRLGRLQGAPDFEF